MARLERGRGGRGGRGGRFPGRRRNPAGIHKRDQDDNRPRRGGQRDRDDNRPRRGGPKRGGRGGRRPVDKKREKATAGDLDSQLQNYWGANKKEQFQDDLNDELDDYFKNKGKGNTDTAAKKDETTA